VDYAVQINRRGAIDTHSRAGAGISAFAVRWGMATYMRDTTLAAVLVIAGLAAPAWRQTACGAEARPAAKPNIVFILIDDMGWTDGGCFGSKFYRTPTLDKLSASGMRFTQAYAACAVCSPTRAAIMTGKYPARLHLTDWIPGEPAPKDSRFRLPAWQQHLPLEETTVAEALKQRDYATAYIGKWHLGSPQYYPQHQGFDLNIAGGDIGHPASYFWPYGDTNNSHRVPGLAEQGGGEGEYLTDHLTGEALKFIAANRNRPFYLQLAHYAVHAPLMGKEEEVEGFRRIPGANGQSNAVYAAMLKSVDQSVARVLKQLDELELSERTIVVFTSDNGGAVHFGQPPATSNAPLRLGKGYAYEGGLRVPLIINVPGITRPGTTCNWPVISQDFFPTLLELAGADQSASRTAVDGVSLVPLLRGEAALARQELFWHYPHYWNGGKVSPYSVVRVGDWKLIRFYETGKEELYDLRADLGEQRDLASVRLEKRRELAVRLDQWLKDVGAQVPVERHRTVVPR
jgi:arylsulfatase A